MTVYAIGSEETVRYAESYQIVVTLLCCIVLMGIGILAFRYMRKLQSKEVSRFKKKR